MTLQQQYEEAIYKARMENDTDKLRHYLKAVERLKYKIEGRENKPQ